jgi:hypothetical protein
MLMAGPVSSVPGLLRKKSIMSWTFSAFAVHDG